jgi:GNAT superfamily N-acetyltransferase
MTLKRSSARRPAVSLRPAGPADAAALDRLLARSYTRLMAEAYPPAVLAAALPLIARANPDLLADGHYYLAADASGEEQAPLLGAGGWSLARPGSGIVEPGLAHIRHFAVDPDVTGRGIGAALYNRCRTAAQAVGLARMEVYASLNAVGFYARMGFARIEDLSIQLTPQVAFAAVLMRRDL